MSVERLVQIVRHLRSPEGCPWDKKQTHESLKPMLIEETAELLDAIDNTDIHNIKEELGDILMHIVFHSILAEEQGLFTFEDVAAEVSDKMERRHPHIFGKNPKLDNPEEVIKLWQEIKAEEKSKSKTKQNNSILGRIPKNMPGLIRAEMIQKKAQEVGFDWKDKEGVLNKIQEEFHEFRVALQIGKSNGIEEEIGDILFSIVNLCRFLKLKPAEELLQKSSDKFTKRFQAMEKLIDKENKNFENYSLEELETLWQEVKKI
ncbi:MAG TPA: nucleoside triphosphate pyrophosphohydrolase [Lentisphaeria bacterium]|nr:MAG: nucleoside triphosphate pyrophosphohydrolase [Lentisphaerae bacterium GWF2_38_69]HBM16483.1 nucleoside triphosphate pyrophosphohydrolase [Lentisphaeria bacterium]